MQIVRNLTAPQAYSSRFTDLLAVVQGLEADLTNAVIDGRTAHWGHVGDLTRALELAEQLRDLLRCGVK